MDNNNPYGNPPGAAVAGRQQALMRLDQYLKDPGGNKGMLLLGRRWQGKTALLHHASSFFDSAAICVYLPGKSLPLESEREFFQAIIAATTRAIVARDISLSRLPGYDPLPEDLRGWLNETWLPEVMQVIRAHRHLLLLLDDAQYYLDALDNARLPGDNPSFLSELLRVQPQLKLVLSLPAEREADLQRLSPLVSADQSIRLSNLPQDATAWLLQEPVGDHYIVTPSAIDAVQQATGGQPRFAQTMAALIYEYVESHAAVGRITAEIVKEITPQVYQRCEQQLESFWRDSTDNEQALLLSISSLHREDPLRKLDPVALESWLVEGEFPLDQTAINAALRSLEYRELILRRPSGIALSSGLFETWLLNHAHHGIQRAETRERRWPVVAIALVALLALAALLLIVNLSTVPQQATSSTAQPTVTLATGD